MSELWIAKFILRLETELRVMESCYKLYTWINDTLLMLLIQFLWKMNQLSDYLTEKFVEDTKREEPIMFQHLTKDSKHRRHVRSMSDVQCSTPYRVMWKSKKSCTLPLMNDSVTRARAIQAYNRQMQESSDSSDDFEMPRKVRNVERKIMKHSDSMRVL